MRIILDQQYNVGEKPTVILYIVVHKEDLVTVDQTSNVGTIPTWLASYFLV